MDQTERLDKNTRLTLSGLLLWVLGVVFFPAVGATARAQPASDMPAWATNLQKSLIQADAAHDGELGVYIKDLYSGVTVTLRGDEAWYLASGIKVPVAIVLLQDIEQGKYSLDSKVRLGEADYVDGAGQTNWHGPGTELTVRFLLEQMLTVSDNTASDLLIRLVGIERVNQLLQDLVPGGFGPVTTLADVRRHVYSGFHRNAHNLSGRDFLALRKQNEEQQRIQMLAELLGVNARDFAMPDINSVFDAYYATNLNGGQLTAYGALLEAIATGRALTPGMTDYLLEMMSATRTGARRIKANLPETFSFAHKTGTQYRRACDMGVVVKRNPGPVTKGATSPQPAPTIVIAACSRNFNELASAEAAMRAVGRAVTNSGIFDQSASGGVTWWEDTSVQRIGLDKANTDP